ncbi:MAG: SMC-Scp complex subunit ScpB [Actinobacteria bacterium]|nr:SMC-Scp complex subunit ScpB [Actinomycetota bacterium]
MHEMDEMDGMDEMHDEFGDDAHDHGDTDPLDPGDPGDPVDPVDEAFAEVEVEVEVESVDVAETAARQVTLPGVPDADTVRAIEAIIMVAVEPVPAELLAQLLEMPTTVIERLCHELARSYDEAGHGFQLVKVAGGFRFQSHPDQSPYVERFLLDGQRARMSGAALETLAIVAYKQPISRAQVASIRGVDPDGVLRTLQARGYITEVARDSGPGQAILFGTTPSFLEKLGLASLADLPPIAEFVPGPEVVEALEHGLRVEPTTSTTTTTATPTDGAS